MISPLDLNSWSSGSPVVILLFLATTGTTLGELGAAKPRPGFFQGGAGGAALGPFRRLRWPAVSEEQSRVANVWNEWSDSDEGYVYAGIYSPDEISRQVKSPKSKGPDPMRRWFGKLHLLFLTNLYSKSQPQNLYKLIETVLAILTEGKLFLLLCGWSAPDTKNLIILLMEEILHHLGCIKPW